MKNLSHGFGGRPVLHNVSFDIHAGERCVLLGLNGAGKTTLFALVTGLYAARGGSIEVFGHSMRRQPRAALASMGVVFQQPTLDLDLTVAQNLAYHAALHGMAPSLARARAEEELERAGLSDRARHRVRALSGGQRRRVELARALLHAPSLLLLDEPTVGLDVESRAFLLDHVRTLCRTQNIGVLWATHLIDEADADSRVIVLHQGRVLADGPADPLSLAATFDRLTRRAA